MLHTDKIITILHTIRAPTTRGVLSKIKLMKQRRRRSVCTPFLDHRCMYAGVTRDKRTRRPTDGRKGLGRSSAGGYYYITCGRRSRRRVSSRAEGLKITRGPPPPLRATRTREIHTTHGRARLARRTTERVVLCTRSRKTRNAKTALPAFHLMCTP